MLTQAWKDTMTATSKDPLKDQYDQTIQNELYDYNNTFAKTVGFQNFTPKIFKAIVWVESGGPTNAAWTKKAMQIGVANDPALKALRKSASRTATVYNVGTNSVPAISVSSDTELDRFAIIMTTKLKTDINGSIDLPELNIRAGISYLVGRHASLGIESQLAAGSVPSTYKVKPGDNLSSIAKEHHSTLGIILQLNPTLTAASMLKLGQEIKVQAGANLRIVNGWSPLTPSSAAKLYNGKGDANYELKLNFVLGLF